MTEDLSKLLQSMKVGTDRTREIIVSLRNFSRLDEAEFKAVDLHEGIGIPLAIQSRLFGPFFTTKPIGKGTDLGLSISYQIVTEKHQGSLRCDSIAGQGTKFTVEIPVKQLVLSDCGK